MGFSFIDFEQASPEERLALMNELAAVLTARVRGAGDFEAEVAAIVGELRAQGHDLWSFDEDDGFQIWCPSWTAKPPRPGIIVDFRRHGEVTVDWPEA